MWITGASSGIGNALIAPHIPGGARVALEAEEFVWAMAVTYLGVVYRLEAVLPGMLRHGSGQVDAAARTITDGLLRGEDEMSFPRLLAPPVWALKPPPHTARDRLARLARVARE